MTMRCRLLLLAVLTVHQLGFGQYKLTIRINSLPPNPVTDVVYVAGNFNNWNPKDELCKFKKDSLGKFIISFPNVPAND